MPHQLTTSTPKVSLGQHVRRCRSEQELTQEELGRPGFSAAYVDAVEQDRIRPSDAVLELLAARLGIAPAVLRTLSQPLVLAPDFAAMAEDFLYQIEGVRSALDTHPNAALAQI